MKKEDKLGDLSMQLSVDVLNRCKVLKKQGGTVISNQIGRSEQVFVRISQRVSMLTAELILLQNFKFHLKKLQKQVNGLKCYIKLRLFQMKNINILIDYVQLLEFC